MSASLFYKQSLCLTQEAAEHRRALQLLPRMVANDALLAQEVVRTASLDIAKGVMAPPKRRSIFTVQKHQASHLHYDLRLEMGGVMKSWAIPKGPSLDPRVKRLAIQVDDHDLAYADFEGVIEEGQYGAGPVLVWDRGWVEPVGRARSLAALWEAGALDFILHGQRLRGRFALIRMKECPRQWLLMKQRDEGARSGREMEANWNTSVLTGRTIEDLERAEKAGQLKALRCGT